MSFNKKRLPDIKTLQELHAERGDEYLKSFEKADVIIGPADSAEYLNIELKRINEVPENNTELISYAIQKLEDAHLVLSTIEEVSICTNEIRKVINYLKIKQ